MCDCKNCKTICGIIRKRDAGEEWEVIHQSLEALIPNGKWRIQKKQVSIQVLHLAARTAMDLTDADDRSKTSFIKYGEVFEKHFKKNIELFTAYEVVDK